MSNTIIISITTLLLSFVISLVLGFIHIRFMRSKHIGQIINTDVPSSHQIKHGTPTFGGLFFITGITITTLLTQQLQSRFILLPLVTMWLFASIGFIDDLAKIVKKESIGLRTSRKLAMQILASALVLYLYVNYFSSEAMIVAHPFDPSKALQVKLWYPLLFLLYMVGFVNAVNISDGLDGLVVTSILAPLALLALIALLVSSHVFSFALLPSIVRNSRATLILLCATIGSLLAFWWYNGPKASVFMGDTGSHALGSLFAIIALQLKVEFVMIIASSVFMIEALSSLIQIISRRLFNKKVFLIAPLHHHYEQKGVSESRIVNRFHIISILSTLIALVVFLISNRI